MDKAASARGIITLKVSSVLEIKTVDYTSCPVGAITDGSHYNSSVGKTRGFKEHSNLCHVGTLGKLGVDADMVRALRKLTFGKVLNNKVIEPAKRT